MEKKQVRARVQLLCAEETGPEVEALFDTGADRSVISQDVAAGLAGCRMRLPPSMRYTMYGASKGSEIRVEEIGVARVRLAGCVVPTTVFDVSADLEPGTVIIGRPELDAWGIQFGPDGPKPKVCPPRIGIV